MITAVLPSDEITGRRSFDKSPKPLHAVEVHRPAAIAAIAPLGPRAALTSRGDRRGPRGRADAPGSARQVLDDRRDDLAGGGGAVDVAGQHARAGGRPDGGI